MTVDEGVDDESGLRATTGRSSFAHAGLARYALNRQLLQRDRSRRVVPSRFHRRLQDRLRLLSLRTAMKAWVDGALRIREIGPHVVTKARGTYLNVRGVTRSIRPEG